jgi:hypothetical protein
MERTEVESYLRTATDDDLMSKPKAELDQMYEATFGVPAKKATHEAMVTNMRNFFEVKERIDQPNCN